MNQPDEPKTHSFDIELPPEMRVDERVPSEAELAHIFHGRYGSSPEKLERLIMSPLSKVPTKTVFLFNAVAHGNMVRDMGIPVDLFNGKENRTAAEVVRASEASRKLLIGYIQMSASCLDRIYDAVVRERRLRDHPSVVAATRKRDAAEARRERAEKVGRRRRAARHEKQNIKFQRKLDKICERLTSKVS